MTLNELREYVLKHGTGGLLEKPISDIVDLIDAKIEHEAHTNLCDNCLWLSPAKCPYDPNTVFGKGVGNDNIIACPNYINREAYSKYKNF